MDPKISISYVNGDSFSGTLKTDLEITYNPALALVSFDKNLFGVAMSGTLIYKNKDTYTGSLNNGKRVMLGEFKFSNGDILTCKFVNDKAHGPGKLVFANKTELHGTWKADKLHGESLYYPNKILRAKLIWDMGELKSQVEISDPNSMKPMTSKGSAVKFY